MKTFSAKVFRQPTAGALQHHVLALLAEFQMLAGIRAEFRACCSSSDDSISAAELTQHWCKLTEEDQQRYGNGLLSLQDKQVILLRVNQLMQEMDIKKAGRISEEEWVHYMLLAQSKRQATQINSLLQNAMVQQPQILKDLQLMFEAADTHSDGKLSFKQVVEMYSRKLWHLRPGNDGRPLSRKELETGDPDQFARQIIEEMDVSGNEQIGYADFMAYCVGRRKQEVTLNLYDLSNGFADRFGDFIISEHLEGVWHTGLCVFGKEYFFSRDTVFDDAGMTSFGKPHKVISLGYTLWRQSELHKFIVEVCKPKFHRGTYDAIDFNCNNFTDVLSMYLVGKHLPEEVYLMSQHLKTSSIIRSIRPILTWWLRDGVVARGNEVSVEAASDATTRVDKPPRVGTTVKIHPADGEEGAPVFGIVTAMDSQPMMGGSGSTLLQGRDFAGQGNKTPRNWDFCGCGYVVPANPQQDKACIQYFDLAFDPQLGSCRGQLRTEYIQLSRLTIEKIEAVGESELSC